VCRLLKDSEARRAKNSSFGFRSGQARLKAYSTKYVVARQLSATKPMRLFSGLLSDKFPNRSVRDIRIRREIMVSFARQYD
jgi:hypothetical protein